MKTNSDRILSIMKFLFWFIFIGLCVQTGSLILTFILSLTGHIETASDLYLGLNLTSLYEFSTWQFVNLMTLIITLSALKAYIAYLVVQIFTKINFDSPFNGLTAMRLGQISHVALGTGILALIANGYNMYLFKRSLIDLSAQPFVEGSREFLFLAGIIFVMAQIFKKGVALQNENELTI
ncbi:DUF2975 domain-containing protein [Hanstruepera ponticola]|uniref:DUF2975 domain-containing protein n=1 Tax=Hanstruepera ponticola TaxID=2042995 RepID=UPI000CF1A041|nr:DUF2975 domain-containing protein [Hanstruepera ponticola]